VCLFVCLFVCVPARAEVWEKGVTSNGSFDVVQVLLAQIENMLSLTFLVMSVMH
jgi:hypothetical protein